MVRAAHQRSFAFYTGCLGWLVACYWFVSNGLGILVVIFSAFLALWVFGLREKFDGEDAQSAYSVFNKGGKAILGGFTGEQLENQLRGSSRPRSLNSHDIPTNANTPLVTTVTDQKEVRLNENEKVRRRCAALAAAERRLLEQQDAE